MKNVICFTVIALVLMSGCAAIKQAREDIETGRTVPLAEGEVAANVKAEKIADTLSGLPYGAGIAAVPLAGFLLTNFFLWRRGRRLRLTGQPTSVKPITGNLGQLTGLELAVQIAADLRAAIFEVGPDGSGAKRGWKGFLYALIGSASFGSLIYPELIDVVNNFIANPPGWMSGILLSSSVAVGSGIVAFLEKQLAKVLPLAHPSSNPA